MSTNGPLKKLGEIGIFIRGVTYNKKDLLTSFIDGCVTLLRSNNIQNKLDLSELQFLPKEIISEEKIVEKDDILFCMSNGSKDLVGKNIILPKLINYSFGAFCSVFRLQNKDYSPFLRYFFQSSLYKDYIFGLSRGIGINNLRNSDLEGLEIPLPPLATQKAIVAKLDEAFASLDESIALTQANIDRLDEMTKSVLDKVFEKGEWEIKKLIDICTIDPKKALINDISVDTEVSFVPMADMNQEEMYFDVKQTRKIGDVRKGYTYFENDDVLLAKVTPCFENGKSGIAKDLTNGIGFGSSEYIVLRKNENVLSKWIYYFVSSKSFREEGAKNMSGAVGLQRVKKEWLRNHLISLPPLSKQQEIVDHLDKVFAETKQLKSEYEAKLQQFKELKASVLQSAFEGKLV